MDLAGFDRRGQTLSARGFKGRQAGLVRDRGWVVLLLVAGAAWAQEPPPAPGGDPAPSAEREVLALRQEQAEAIKTDVDTDENPDAGRRAEREAEPPKAAKTVDYDLYGSARIHAINAFDAETGDRKSRLGDGASRIGASGAWTFREGWDLFGRLEAGFDILDTFTTKGQTDSGGRLTARLHSIGVESDSIYVRYGKSWSTYYKVAGSADRFAIFGGEAAGVYNAGTDGGATGTGRADGALQTQLYVDINRWIGIKPFNLNVQYQHGEPIPRLEGLEYGSTWSFSAWVETEREVGIGLAYHHAEIDAPTAGEALSAAGVDGDATALALAFKTYGSRWLASLVFARLENMETTDQFRYFNGTGIELFGQWEFGQNWWFTAGGNRLTPDGDQPQAGDYEIRYMVLGLRYTLDSFHRMLYAEWRNDFGTLTDGTPAKNEFTVGLRWDFGY